MCFLFSTLAAQASKNSGKSHTYTHIGVTVSKLPPSYAIMSMSNICYNSEQARLILITIIMANNSSSNEFSGWLYWIRKMKHRWHEISTLYGCTKNFASPTIMLKCWFACFHISEQTSLMGTLMEKHYRSRLAVINSSTTSSVEHFKMSSQERILASVPILRQPKKNKQ